MIKMFEELIENDTREVLYELKNVILLILTTIDLLFIFLSITYTFNFKIEHIFADYDFLVCLLLFIDLAYDYYIYDGTLRDFLIGDKNLFTIISILPYDLIFRYFSIFRLFRFVKVIKLVRIYNIKRDFGSVIYFIQHHLFKVLFIVLVVYVGLSSALLIIIDESINSLPDALWFVIVTASSVGYGDIVPATPVGKALSVLTIIMGTMFVAIVTAYLSAIYNEKPERETRDAVIKHIKNFEKRNESFKKEVHSLNDKVERMEKENQDLNEKLSQMNQMLDEISKKLD